MPQLGGALAKILAGWLAVGSLWFSGASSSAMVALVASNILKAAGWIDLGLVSWLLRPNSPQRSLPGPSLASHDPGPPDPGPPDPGPPMTLGQPTLGLPNLGLP